MSNKHAYLIISHNQFEVLKFLLKALDYEKNDIYLHIDKKAGNIDCKQFYDCLQSSNLFILEKRINVSWGNFSQIECELELLEVASKRNYKYYHLISRSRYATKKTK